MCHDMCHDMCHNTCHTHVTRVTLGHNVNATTMRPHVLPLASSDPLLAEVSLSIYLYGCSARYRDLLTGRVQNGDVAKYVVVPSDIVYSHTCDGTALTSISTRVSIHVWG